MDSLEGNIAVFHRTYTHKIVTFRCSRSGSFPPQYALYKKMTLAAILIQSKFRSYYEQKKFQQSRRAAMLIQQYYRSYKELGRPTSHSHAAAAAALVQHKLRYGHASNHKQKKANHSSRFWHLLSGWEGYITVTLPNHRCLWAHACRRG